MVKHATLELFHGDKCVNYCALKETIAKTRKHIQRTRDLEIFLEKIVDTGTNVVRTFFLHVVVVANNLKFPGLGSPTGKKSEKNTQWEALTGGKSEQSIHSKDPKWKKIAAAISNSVAWKAPTKGESKKNTHWEGPTGGKTVALTARVADGCDVF